MIDLRKKHLEENNRYGWEDEKHDWKSIGNFSVIEPSHKLVGLT